jgi:hypothetical protein
MMKMRILVFDFDFGLGAEYTYRKLVPLLRTVASPQSSPVPSKKHWSRCKALQWSIQLSSELIIRASKTQAVVVRERPFAKSVSLAEFKVLTSQILNHRWTKLKPWWSR